MDIFGKKTIEEKDGIIQNLIGENFRLQKRIDEKNSMEYVLKEKIPEEQNARRSYMSDVTMFYRKIFKDKLSHMISLQKDSLAIIDQTREKYLFYRANINTLFLIDNWMSQCEKEHLGDMADKRQQVEDGIGIINEIKTKNNL